MTPRGRVLSFGSAGFLVIAGAICAALLTGGAAQILAFLLIGLGFVLATGLVFLEVGLSEDRERARKRGSRGSTARREEARSKLVRARGYRRRLR